MSPLLTFSLAFKALFSNKLRTALTMLGIIIGVSAVIAMLSIGSGARHMMEQRIQAMGTNAVFIWPGSRRGRNRGAEGTESKLTVADWQAVVRLPEVASAAPVVMASVEMVNGPSSWSTRVVGSTPAYAYQRSWK